MKFLPEALAWKFPGIRIDCELDEDKGWKIKYFDGNMPSTTQLATIYKEWEARPQPPRWADLRAYFSAPNNQLYLDVRQLVAISGFKAQDTWQNLKVCIQDPTYWQTERLAASINMLSQELILGLHPMPSALAKRWNAVMVEYGFPVSCQLPV